MVNLRYVIAMVKAIGRIEPSVHKRETPFFAAVADDETPPSSHS
jgi:hypothetical protein